ncbi:MAG: alanine--tRNA ligase [Candidatus Omnitrophota bacterium]
MKTDDIRSLFLEFFRAKGHEIVPSDLLVPKDDPTLLFTGAGMNQFKEKFLGRNVTYRRAASSQKCLRTGDLENVGKTSGHHTFFEMLGNFSFGDYFKKEAISWAWEFMTEELKIPEGRLRASVYKDDAEAYAIWRDVIKMPERKIIKFGEKENFWPSEAPTKGPNGPCGPCSEIFYDYGDDVGCKKPGCTPACDCGRFIEVWNLVFTQFDRRPDGKLEPLPNKNIDTGMGLERLASVMQGVKTNFEIDIFVPIVKEIIKGIGFRVSGIEKARPESPYPIPYTLYPKLNAIADHIRAVAFMIADGVMPSNEERGYVARKLIRRSLNHAMDLEIKVPFLYKLVSTVCEVMKMQYPELLERRDDIAQVVKREEENFLVVLDTQIPKVEEAFEKFKGHQELAETAFNFYDTYGMPYDMLEEIAEKFKLKIDRAVFDKLLDRQRTLSRSKSKIKGEIFSETFAKKVESLGLRTEFLGYEKAKLDAKVAAVLEGGEVILERTPFYGESGGQAGDWGTIETPSGKMEVKDAKKIGDTIVHIGIMVKGRIVKGETARVAIDEEVRRRVMRNHTATHLLQAALRRVLGEHVHQTGSLVDAEHLRFDFTHMKKMEPREIARVEEIVNEAIKKGVAVAKDIKDIDDAKQSGAIALFGEKYGSKVRVISVGDISREFCGGTHVDNTKDIELFRITGESSIASGVRRIEAVTADAARKWAADEIEARDAKLKDEKRKEKEKTAKASLLKSELEKVDSYIAKGIDAGGTRVIAEIVPGGVMDILRALSDAIKSKERSAVIVLASKDNDKVSFVVSLTKDILGRKTLTANDIAKDMAKYLSGSGGGRPDFAQGGGKDPSKLDEALRKTFELVKERLR